MGMEIQGNQYIYSGNSGYTLPPIDYSNKNGLDKNNNFPIYQNGVQTIKNGLSGLTTFASETARGVGNLAGILGNELQRLGQTVGQLAPYTYQTNMMRRFHYHPWHSWHSPCLNRYQALRLLDPVPYFPTNYYTQYNQPMTNYPQYSQSTSHCGQQPYIQNNSCTCNSGQSTPTCNSNSQLPSSSAREALEKLLYPERYPADNNSTTSSNDNSPKETPLPEKDSAPTWVTDIQDRVDKKQQITSEQQNLLDSYKKLNKQYSPFKIDDNGNIIYDAEGKPQFNSLGNDINFIQNALESKQTEAVLAKLRQMPLEQVAAIEAHYQKVTGKNLREEIKESCSWTGFGWLNWNTDKSKQILDYLDQAALTNPQNMASALRQAINDHHLFGFGIDDDRIAKLFNLMKDKPEFRRAVNYEYSQITGSMLSSDISDKWFISDNNKWITQEL